MRSWVRAVALLAVATVGTLYAAQEDPSWPPGVQAVSDASPARSPADEMATFHMPPGYRVELVASEPLVEDPILMDWDPDGRLWVVEMPSFMSDMPATHEHDPTGRIVVLQDTDGDGRMDTRTVFLDGLVLPRALKVLADGVLVGEPPNLWLVRDLDGDLHADTKTLVTDTYGTRDAGPEHNANGLFWAMDNWMHTAEHDGDLRWTKAGFELRRTLSRGQWGVTMDDAGRLYRNTNSAALFVDYVPAHYYARNPSMIRTRGFYDSLQNREVNTVWPVRPTRGVNRGYQTGVLRSDGTLAAFTSVSAPTVYRGDRLPADLRGNVFLVEPAGNLVSRLVLNDDGSGLVAHKAYDRAEFLASTDERFRPVNLSSAPDGTLYIADMYRGIIQHQNFITEYLRDQILARHLVQPIHRGRIYRVMYEDTQRGPAPALSEASSSQLVAALSHPNGWWRDTAQQLLVQRGDLSVVPALSGLATTASDWRTRLHALWTLDGLGQMTPALAIGALRDPERDVRVSGLRLAEHYLADPPNAVRAAVLDRLDDPDWAVERQLAATLGELPPDAREAPIATLLERHPDDQVLIDAAITGLRGHELSVLGRLIDDSGGTPANESAITMLAATITRGAQDAGVQQVLARVADASRPDWERSALLDGAELALFGGPMPGTSRPPPRQVATAPRPCPTCPGGRAGPGGAPAFATASGASQASRGGPHLRLSSEPRLAALPADALGPLGDRVARLFERIEWPGKPGATPVTPLTPDEERRFAAGKQVFQTLCQACHQADGRGQDKVAPSLVGSALALGPAAVTARILLNGKEGTVGLMPPLGATLTDEQIAGVLTYVRREWGQTGSPVDVPTVAAARAATAGRTRPWTNDELARVAAGGQ